MRTALLVAGVTCLICFAVIVGAWILYGKSHSKALKALGYDNTILVYIPLVNYYMIADAALFGDEEMPLFGSLRVPANFFKFWWVLLFVLTFIPGIGTLLTTVVTIVCLGTCYKRIYARLEDKDESETAVIGYVSGFLPIVAVVKFLTGHYDDYIGDGAEFGQTSTASSVNQGEQTTEQSMPTIQRVTPSATVYSKQIVTLGKQISKSGSIQIGKKNE